MGQAMAGATAGKMIDNGLGVGLGVAFLADRDGLVSTGMTLGASDLAVLGPAAAEQGIGLLVAGAAIFGRGICRQGYHERHMGTMALFTGLVGHPFEVGGVAVGAGGQVPMLGVAGRTGKGGMDGLVFLELLQLTVMAGGAGAGDGPGQADLQGGVGIGVAGQAIAQSEMGGPLVAAATGRDNLFVPGGVTDMAVLAGKLVAVRHAICLEDGDNGRVAFYAISEQELLVRRWDFRSGFDGFGNGFVAGGARTGQEKKHGYGQGKIFGCKY